jgi:hypothetical protein
VGYQSGARVRNGAGNMQGWVCCWCWFKQVCTRVATTLGLQHCVPCLVCPTKTRPNLNTLCPDPHPATHPPTQAVAASDPHLISRRRPHMAIIKTVPLPRPRQLCKGRVVAAPQPAKVVAHGIAVIHHAAAGAAAGAGAGAAGPTGGWLRLHTAAGGRLWRACPYRCRCCLLLLLVGEEAGP